MKLMIIDRSEIVYSRLIELLGGVSSFTALSVAHNIDESFDKALTVKPNVVIIDIDLCNGRYIQALHQLRRQLPGSKIYFFSNYSEYKAGLLSLGVDAFFDKSLEFELLVQTLKQDTEYARQK